MNELETLRAENQRLQEALTSIQTTQSRKLLYNWLTLEDAKQIGANIEAIVSCAMGDLTTAEMQKAIKPVPIKS